MATLILVVGVSLAALAILFAAVLVVRAIRAPKVRSVVDRRGRRCEAYRLRVLARTRGPIVLISTKDLVSLRLYDDHVAMGVLRRARYPYAAIAKVERIEQAIGGQALRLTMSDGKTWAIKCYGPDQTDTLLQSLRSRGVAFG